MKFIKLRWVAFVLLGTACTLIGPFSGNAQDGRAGLIASRQQEKSKNLQPETPGRYEKAIASVLEGGWFMNASPHGLYPYFDSVYSGGGFTLGAGYRRYYGDASFAELRGLYSAKNYKKIEFHSVSPGHAGGLFDLEFLGGWTDATQIPYYGLGIDTTEDHATNFRIQRTYVRGGIKVKPSSWSYFRATSGYDRFLEMEGTGSDPTVGDLFDSSTAPALGVGPSYIHTEITAAAVTAPSEGYARQGGVYKYTFQDFRNVHGDIDSFQLHRAEAVQHIPILRETWVLSLRGRLESTTGGDATVPYYLLPWLGSGSTLRGYGTGRFRDRNSLLFSGEWRWIPNRFFMDMALFYDAGTVAPSISDLGFDHMKQDYGVGIRFHGPTMTAFRFDVAHGSEGFHLILSASAPF
jgi:hypothetical protein